jgi:hypothetical protein
MTLAEMTVLMSKVGRKHPELMQDRNVSLFIQACIDEAKDMEKVREVGVTPHFTPDPTLPPGLNNGVGQGPRSLK